MSFFAGARVFLVWLALIGLASCTEPVGQGASGGARILAMGDSLMAWNSVGQASIPHAIETRLGEDVVDRSVPGAFMIYDLPISGSLGLRISKQYVQDDWDWVILNGGGNDLWLGCGCGDCSRRMARMLSPDGSTGEVAKLVQKIRGSGAKVIYLGYLRTPGRDSPIDQCAPVGDDFEDRLQAMADRDPGVFFLSNSTLVPHGDLSYHAADRIHPSIKASAAIGTRVARLIQRSGS